MPSAGAALGRGGGGVVETGVCMSATWTCGIKTWTPWSDSHFQTDRERRTEDRRLRDRHHGPTPAGCLWP